MQSSYSTAPADWVQKSKKEGKVVLEGKKNRTPLHPPKKTQNKTKQNKTKKIREKERKKERKKEREKRVNVIISPSKLLDNVRNSIFN